jgi:uncharacterized protein with GYD domain
VRSAPFDPPKTFAASAIPFLLLRGGDSDLVIFVDAPSGDNVAKFALAVSSLGNVRTRTVRAWSADEYRKLISELP